MGSVTIIFLLPLALLLSPLILLHPNALLEMILSYLLLPLKYIVDFVVMAPIWFGQAESLEALLATYPPWITNLIEQLVSWLSNV